MGERWGLSLGDSEATKSARRFTLARNCSTSGGGSLLMVR